MGFLTLFTGYVAKGHQLGRETDGQPLSMVAAMVYGAASVASDSHSYMVWN